MEKTEMSPEEEQKLKKEEKKNKLIAAQEETTRNMEAAAIRLENANAEFKANMALKKQQELEAQMEGKSEAGKTPEVKEETPLEYKNRVMRGDFVRKEN